MIVALYYGSKFFITFGAVLGTGLDVTAFILLILGIIGLVKHMNSKDKQEPPAEDTNEVKK